MEMNTDIRWVQRLDNYDKAVTRLDSAVSIVSREQYLSGEVSDLLKEGLIQRFEYTQELAWKVLKDYEEYQGFTDIQGSRDAIRKAFQIGLVSDRAWMDTISSRNITSHCYDEEEFNMVYRKIVNDYVPIFKELSRVMNEKKDNLLLPYEFDISLFSTLQNQALKEHILRRGICVYERPAH